MPAHYSVTQPIQPTGSIVDRATSILDGERAGSETGALPSVGELPERVVGELEKRFGHLREQAQDLVDQLARVAERLPAASLESGSARDPKVVPTLHQPTERRVPELRAAHVGAGGIAKTALGLVNDAESPASVVLRATSFVSEHGDELPGTVVTFAPNPVNLPPNTEFPVQADVRVPVGTRPGKYSGLVQALGLEATHAVMTIHVIRESAKARP
jgi:hypothetical protein